MNDVVETVLDLASWVLAGTFLGLSALGGLYFYTAYHQPTTPDISVEPIKQTRQRPSDEDQNFRPLKEFYLVQEYGPDKEEASESKTSSKTEEASGPENTKPSVPAGKLAESQLPYKLVGTVTGSQALRYAVVQNLRKRKSKTLKPGESWGALTLEEVHDQKIIITNNQANRREKISLIKKDKQKRP